MDAFIDQDFSTDTLNTLQKCRLFYGADTLADISTADGKHIDPSVWWGRSQNSRSRKHWMQTRRPTQNEWTRWQSALKQTFLLPHDLNRKLARPLGHWSLPEDDQWNWWLDRQSDVLYQRSEDNIIRWTRRTGHSFTRKYHLPVITEDAAIPKQCNRVSVNSLPTNEVVRILSVGFNTAQHLPPSATTLQATIDQLHPDARWSVQNTETTDQGHNIAHALATGQAIAVSDGSLKWGFGTAALVIEGVTDQHRVRAVNVVPGPIKEGDSHRCELSGLYGIVSMIQCITKLHHVLRSHHRCV